MSTAIEVNIGKVVPRAFSSVLDIPLDRIQESKTNPRRQFDPTKLTELADNIRMHGVLQPVLVRQLPDGAKDAYELVVGTRRYRASKLAGRQTIPATVRELTDAQCLELQLIENLQRADVHELDEAQGYATLIQLQPEAYTVETIATKVARSQAYVYGRLRLNQLVDDVKHAFYCGKLTFAHAFEIARLRPGDQDRALLECFPNHSTAAVDVATVRELREWIEREIHLDLTNAPFDPQDELLLPSAGSCAKCSKRTGNNPLLFPEVRHKSICTDRDCYRAKVEALVQMRVKPFVSETEKPLRVSQVPSWQTNGRAQDVVYEGQYRIAESKGECESARLAVVIDGKTAGTIFYLCQNAKCSIHARVTRYQPTPQQRAQRTKELLAERVEKLTRIRILDAIREKLPETLARPDLEMAILDYFRRLGHDNHRRLCKVYSWQEKKTKTSWGGESVNYEKIATEAVQSMTNADMHRFLVVCALVSNLYCPSFDASKPLGKDSNLARTAARYSIDAGKVASATRAELSQPKHPTKTRINTEKKSAITSTKERNKAKKMLRK